MKPDQERVRHLLTDTVTLLCKNGLQYKKELRVQGLLGITLDDSDVFVVHINEKFGDLIGGAISLRTDDEESDKLMIADNGGSSELGRDDMKAAHHVKLKRRRKSSESPVTPSSDDATNSQQIVHRPVKRLISCAPSSGPRADKRSFHSGSMEQGLDRTVDDVHASSDSVQTSVDVKVKVEDDVMIVDDTGNSSSCDPSASNIVHSTDATYPGLSLNEIQSNYQHFEEILGIADASADPGGGDAGSKRHITQDPYSQSGNASDLASASGGPYVTGVMNNTSGVQDSMNSTWDSSQMSLHSTGYTPDGQSMLSSAPGCSTWDASQSAAASRQAISGTEQGEESIGWQNTALLYGGAHSGSVRRDKSFRCDYANCVKAFVTREKLVRHQVEKHGRQRVRPVWPRRSWKSSDKAFICEIAECGRRYFSLASLAQHQKLKHSADVLST